MSDEITLYGAGGHCRVVIDLLEENDFIVSQIVDDDPREATCKGIPILRPLKEYKKVLITIGDCQIRKRISKEIKVEKFLKVIHPKANVSKSVLLGIGSVIMAGVTIQSGTKIGEHCIINTNASIDHDCIVHDYVHVAPGATVCGECEIGECSWVGAGAVIIQCLKIGKNCTIGAGAVIIEDVPDNAVVVGNPGRIIRFKSK